MLKVRTTGAGGKDTILLGLSAENLRRLPDDKPILVRGDDVGLEVDIVIFSGETEEAMADYLRAKGLALPRAN